MECYKYTHGCFSVNLRSSWLKINIWQSWKKKEEKNCDSEPCHFHQTCDVMIKATISDRKCMLRHEPAFFCSSLVKSKPAWLCPEELKFKARIQFNSRKL